MIEHMFASAGNWDEGLDDDQLSVALHGDTPLVVIAGAGTGKTRALTSRVASLLDRGVPPDRILLLTFTRRAADDMLERAARLVRVRGAARPLGGTFHAVAHFYIGICAEALGLSEGFSVLDPSEASDLIDLMRSGHGLSGTEIRLPRSSTLVEIHSRCVNREQRLSEVVAAEYPWCEPHVDAIASLFRAFGTRKRKAGLLDFDDLLLLWRALLRHDTLGPDLAGRFDYVLVDEYQDVNALQVDIVRALAPEGRGLTVVGDEAQAIYGFRGADARHLREVVLGSPNATTIRLQQNYRSRQAILDVANAVRPGDSPALCLVSSRDRGARPTLVKCHDAPAEARLVVDSILTHLEQGMPLFQQAVLVRTGHHSDLVELELSARKVPFRKFGGLRFLEAAHVKDFVSAARLLENPHDEIAWYRFLRLHEGIGPSRARTMVEHIVGPDGSPLEEWPEIVARSPAAVRTRLSASFAALNDARSQIAPGARAERVLSALRPLLLGRYDDAHARLRDLERLVDAAAHVASLGAWLAELAIDPPKSTGDLAGPAELDDDYVTISTIHSAKGLEWSVVHLPHLIDGAVPSDMALTSRSGLEEEQRLFYVALTRARDELRMYVPLRIPFRRRSLDDRHGFAPMSRFLDDAAMPLVDALEVLPERPASVAGPARGSSVTVDLDALWA
jgi:DNA helicase-2/ATP-dependent DNA helicase PcrA